MVSLHLNFPVFEDMEEGSVVANLKYHVNIASVAEVLYHDFRFGLRKYIHNSPATFVT